MSKLFRQTVDTIRPYLAFIEALFQTAPWLTVALGALFVLRSLAPVGFVVGAATVVERVPTAVQTGLDSAAGRDLQLGFVVMVIAFLVQQITPALQQSTGYDLGNRYNIVLEQRLMRATISPAGIGHLEDPQLHNEILAATRGLTGWQRPADGPNALAARLSAKVSFIGASALLVFFHWWVALPVLISGLWLQAQIIRSLSAQVEAQIGMAAAQRRSFYFRELALTPPAAKEIRVFGIANWLVDRYRESFTAALRLMRAERERGRRPLLAATAAMFASITGTLLLVGWQAGTGQLTLAQIALAIQAIAIAVPQVGEEQVARDGLTLRFTLRSLATVTNAERRLAKVPRALAGSRDASDLPQQEIRFEGVWFRYPGQDHDVLCGVDLTVPAGHSLAIVGANGAGKTTMIKLLCRLYEPTKGRITVDGIDLRDIDPSGWQRRVTAIFQDYIRYPLSAADNVTFGGLDRADDQALLEKTAAKVGIANHVERLSHGWQTILSREYEGGVDLSGGQWQRVALARAMFAAGAGSSVLILDEPTANLDVRGEAEIYERFLDLTSGLTTLLISHRFSTVRRAERICVLEEGRVIEEGDHDSLMISGGRYAELFRLQAKRFIEDIADDSSERSEVTS